MKFLIRNAGTIRCSPSPPKCAAEETADLRSRRNVPGDEISLCAVPSRASIRLPFDPSYIAQFKVSRFLIMPNALPADVAQRWQSRAVELVNRTGTEIQRNGSDSGKQRGLSYRVITGETIKEQFPELYQFYTDPETANWIKKITGESRITTSSHLRSAINMNILEKPGHVYRWHFDAAPYTLLLYLTTNTPEEGGGLELIPNAKGLFDPGSHINPDGMKKITVPPVLGTLFLMDGTTTYHSVEPVHRRTMRLSVPMVYPPTDEMERPEGLDESLYGKS